MSRHAYNSATPLVMVITAWLSASCSGSGGTGAADIAGSCSIPANGICVEYGADYQGLTLDRLCKSQKGEHSAGACPAEGRAGSCLVKRDGKSSTYRYYAGFPGYGVALGDGVAAAAEEQCVNTIKGTWTKG